MSDLRPGTPPARSDPAERRAARPGFRAFPGARPVARGLQWSGDGVGTQWGTERQVRLPQEETG